jgi:xanthine dehydrogenase molybdopterin-binding subunit B
MSKRQLKYVGHSVPRVDGIEKVTGKAKFLGDLMIPGMLYGKILRSSYPHARILSIDTSKAEAWRECSHLQRSAGDCREQSSLRRRAGGGAGGSRYGDS